MSEANEVAVGATQLVTTPRPRSVADAQNYATEVIAEAKRLVEGERQCKGRVKIRDANGVPLRDEAGKLKTRQCVKYAIKGGFVCPTHGGSAPQVKKKAAKRLLALVDPALVRLGELMDQSAHLPTALGAVKTVLERAGTEQPIGPLAAKAEEKDTRPIINIGIKVGGIETVTQPAITGEVIRE